MSMTNEPAAKRPFHAFVSYSHQDAEFVGKVVEWLESTGLRIYRDTKAAETAEPLSSRIASRINESWSLLLFLTKASARSQWVEDEWEYALKRRRDLRGFRITVIRVGGVDVPSFLSTTSYIDIPQPDFTFQCAVQILAGVNSFNDGSSNATGRDLYVARSWRQNTAEFDYAHGICRRLADAEFRLIGDAKGHFDSFSLDRIRALIESCAGFVAILPHRGGQDTSEEMREEVRIAQALGKPALLIADDNVRNVPEYPTAKWWKASELDPAKENTIDDQLTPAIERLIGAAIQTEPRCLFLAPARHFDAQFQNHRSEIVKVLERVVRVPCVLGETDDNTPFESDLSKLRAAVGIIADLSAYREIGLISIGAALGAQRPFEVALHLEEKESPRYLKLPRLWRYSTSTQLLGVVHRIATRYRRQVYNDILLNS